MKRALSIVVLILVVSISGAIAHAWSARQQQAPPRPPAGTASISGQVTRVDNGKPIANATVQLVPSMGGMPQRVASDAGGKFTMSGLGAGTYVLTVTAGGYVALDAIATRPTGFGRVVTLKDDEHVEQMDVQLGLPSAIEGRVLDEFGDPAPGITIQIAQLMIAAGRSRFMPMSTRQTDVSNDLGRFRIFGLPPGEYYLVALSGPFGIPPGGSMLSSSPDDRAGFAPTYFPGTAIASEAKPVVLEVGKDALGLTFSLMAAPLSTLSGRLVDATGQAPKQAAVQMLQVQGGDVRAMIPANVPVGPDGTFRFRNVPAGNYVLQGMTPTGFGALMVTAAGRDQTLTLALHPPATARGRIVFEGDGQPAPGTAINIALRATDFVSGPVGGNGAPRARISDDWSFVLPGLQSTGVLRTTGAAPGAAPWYLKNVVLDGKDITDTPYDFGAADVSNLEIVLTNRSASLSGPVTDDAKPATRFSVLVFAADPAKWAFPSRMVAIVTGTPQGTFKVGGLPGGDYLAVAVPLMPPVPEIDPSLLALLRPHSTAVTLTAGATATVALRMTRDK